MVFACYLIGAGGTLLIMMVKQRSGDGGDGGEFTESLVVAGMFIAAGGGIYKLAKVIRVRRLPPGACRQCGYDLRATPDPRGPFLAVCPECGETAALTDTVD
jgi:hypothetical protein